MIALLCALPAAAAGEAGASGGAFARGKHGDASRGVERDASWPAGSCEQCHAQHGGGAGPGNDFLLFDRADNSTCLSAGCHDTAYLWPPGNYHHAWPGDGPGWSHSAHGNSSAPFPPVDGRPVSNCAQCHDPHGVRDPLHGLLPSLTRRLEEEGALARDGAPSGGCHGSDPAWRPAGAKDLAGVFERPYRHPLAAGSKLHSWDWSEGFPYGKESRESASGDLSGARRHVECADCHNPHRAQPGTHVPGSNAAPPVLLGAWGVEPAFGPGGSVPPAFSVVEFEPGTGREYQLCMKCHSAFAFGTVPPPGSSDQAREFNPANRSFHPVVAGTSLNSYTSPSPVNGMRETMEAPWNNGRHDLMTCSDCHAGDRPEDPAGPHGSTFEGLLVEAGGERDDGFCLRCHRAEVYAPAFEPHASETGSRFDEQTTGEEMASHYGHVTHEGVHCRECHGGRQSIAGPFVRGSAHGTNLFPGLMNGTGITGYIPGSCTPACHGRETYAAGPE